MWGLCSWHSWAWLRENEKSPAQYIPDITEIRGTWYQQHSQPPQGAEPGAHLEETTGHRISPRLVSPVPGLP